MSELHARQQIMELVRELVADQVETCEVQRARGLEADRSSRIDIDYSGDVTNEERTTLDTEAREMGLVLTVTVRAKTGGAGPGLDAIALVIERRLGGGNARGRHLIAGARVDIVHTDTVPANDEELEKAVGRLAVGFAVHYRIEPGDPAQMV